MEIHITARIPNFFAIYATLKPKLPVENVVIPRSFSISVKLKILFAAPLILKEFVVFKFSSFKYTFLPVKPDKDSEYIRGVRLEKGVILLFASQTFCKVIGFSISPHLLLIKKTSGNFNKYCCAY